MFSSRLLIGIFLITSIACGSAPDQSVNTLNLATQVTITPPADMTGLSRATFAGGCFWCEEAIFERVKGVKEVISGYSGGKSPNPTYESVGSGRTDHAESFEVYYDPKIISYSQLLDVYFASIDPTQANGQGPDHGRQYRSLIFYRSPEEQQLANAAIKNLTASGTFRKPIAVEVVPFIKFWQAEDYHQNYVKLHPEHPYVLGESIPRMERTLKKIKHLVDC
jgi:peptide-methionine (S)-S-oxide reductase